MGADGIAFLLIASLAGVIIFLVALVFERFVIRYKWHRIRQMREMDPVAAGHRRTALMGQRSRMGFR